MRSMLISETSYSQLQQLFYESSTPDKVYYQPVSQSDPDEPVVLLPLMQSSASILSCCSKSCLELQSSFCNLCGRPISKYLIFLSKFSQSGLHLLVIHASCWLVIEDVCFFCFNSLHFTFCLYFISSSFLVFNMHFCLCWVFEGSLCFLNFLLYVVIRVTIAAGNRI